MIRCLFLLWALCLLPRENIYGIETPPELVSDGQKQWIWVAPLYRVGEQVSPGVKLIQGPESLQDLNQQPEVELQGEYRGAVLSGNQFYLLFKEALYQGNAKGEDRRLLLKAPFKWEMVALVSGENNEACRVLLLAPQSRLWAMDLQGGKQAISGDWQGTWLGVWSARQWAGIIMKNDAGELSLEVLMPQNDIWQRSSVPLGDKLPLALADSQGGILLLTNKEVYRWPWGNGEIIPYAMPPLESGFHWRSYAQLGEQWLALAGDDRGGYVMHHSDLPPLPLQKRSSPLGEESNFQNTVGLLLPYVMFSAFLVVLVVIRQKQMAFLQDNMKIHIKDVSAQEAKSASLLLRALAFWMDFSIVLAPVMFLLQQQYPDTVILLMRTASQYFIDGGEGMRYGMMQMEEMSAEDWQRFVFILMLQTLVMACYHIVMEVKFGGSLGKLFFRMRVLPEQGGLPTWSQSIKRNLLRVLDCPMVPAPFPLGLISCWLSWPRRLSFGDRVAGTRVVRDRMDRVYHH